MEIILMVNQLDGSLSVGILGSGGKLISGDAVLFERCGNGQLEFRLRGVHPSEALLGRSSHLREELADSM